jgi:two-component system, NarL family, invasion response regulator UvrY
MIRVIIADDHELIRNGFAGLVSGEDDMRLVGAAGTAQELIDLLRRNAADVVVLDIGLPDRNGLEVLRDIRSSHRTVRTLILSMHPEERYAQRAIADGASGYLTKDSASEELVTAIRRVYERGYYVSQALADELVSDLGNQDPPLPHISLSDREYELLLLIGEGRTMRDAAEQLNLSINTVNSYRRRLTQKMRLRSTSELIRYVLHHNLIE